MTVDDYNMMRDINGFFLLGHGIPRNLLGKIKLWFNILLCNLKKNPQIHDILTSFQLNYLFLDNLINF